MISVKNIVQDYFSELKTAVDAISLDDIQKIANVLLSAYKKDKTVFILGNGGAASTASHMSCDLGKGTLKNVYNKREKRFRAISLTDNVATMTAFANDLSYDDMFVQQLHNLVKKGDIVIGISGSGNTPNIIKALMYAKDQGAITVGFLGYHNGGKAKEFVDYDITIQSASYGIIEDLHLALGHVFTSCLSYVKKHADAQEVLINDSKSQTSKKSTNSSKTQKARRYKPQTPAKGYTVSEWTERSARK